MPTQPTNPPLISQFTGVPNSATDTPAEFDTKANQTVQEWVTNIDQQNTSNDWTYDTSLDVYNNALEAFNSATSAAQSASDAEIAFDNAKQAVNLKGYWSDQTGSATKPYSVIHNDGLWLLVNDLADVTASEPSTTNSDWFLAFKRATDLDVEAGSDFSFADANQVKNKLVQRNWEDLAIGKSYNESCFYRGKEYVVRNPIADDQIDVAPPSSAGRSYFEFDGVNDISTSISVLSGYVVKVKFSEYRYRNDFQKIFDCNSVAATSPSRSFLQFIKVGDELRIDARNVSNFKFDGVTTSLNSKIPNDMLSHSVELTIAFDSTIDIIGNGVGVSNNFTGRIYDLEIFNTQGERIHYYPLRTDAVDYLAGNLINDEEFTWEGNWEATNNSLSVSNNEIKFTNSPSASIIKTLSQRDSVGTYRYLYDYDVSLGGIRGFSENTFVWDTLHSGVGSVDQIVVHSNVGTSFEGFTCLATTTGTVKNFRAIKLNELSPSADFSGSSGFNLVGGVTIDTVNKQAVFAGIVGNAAVQIPYPVKSGIKYRLVGRTTGTTIGSWRPMFLSVSTGTPPPFITQDIEFDEILTALQDGSGFQIFSNDGWDGKVEYFSVTEVTDGTENGTIGKNFDRYWQLTNGEQSIQKSVGTLEFNDIPQVLTGTSYKIAPLSTANLRDRIVVSRAGELEPVIELDADDIADGRRITHPNSQPDTDITLDSNDKITLEFNGQDLEVYRG